MELAPHIPIERCRLVEYNYDNNVMNQSLDLDEVWFYLSYCYNYYIKFSFSIKLLDRL